MSDDLTNDVYGEEEWEEEICPTEVERVINRLEELMESVESDTVHELLTEAYEKIEGLVDWEEDDNDQNQAEAA